jgi:hypothetical protein
MEVSLADAVAWIAQGGVLAYPTETVWGLGADARSDAAVGRLRAFKGRDDAAPISILVTGIGALGALGFRLEAAAERLAREFWPGPLTLVLPCDGAFASGIAREDGAIGVRCTPHEVANELAMRLRARRYRSAHRDELQRERRAGRPHARGGATRVRARSRRACDRNRRRCGKRSSEHGRRPDRPRPRVLRWGALGESALRPILEELAA